MSRKGFTIVSVVEPSSPFARPVRCHRNENRHAQNWSAALGLIRIIFVGPWLARGWVIWRLDTYQYSAQCGTTGTYGHFRGVLSEPKPLRVGVRGPRSKHPERDGRHAP